MSRSNEGHESDDNNSNSNIDEIDEKLQHISVNGRDRDGDGDGDDDDDDVVGGGGIGDGNTDGVGDGDNDDDDGTSEHEQSSTLSQANYYDEPSLQLTNLNHLFHIDFMRSMQNLRTHEKRFKNGTRRSATFTNEQMRQIERENQILLKKILAQRPRSSIHQQPQQPQQSTSRIRNTSRVASAAINRRYQQERIDFANNILRKKIEKIAHRNPK